MTLRCRHCHAPVQRAAVALRYDVGGRTFTARANGRPCAICGADGVDEETRQRFTLLVASQLAQPNGATIKFIREALRFRASEIAQLLDVSIETLSRWENDRRVIPRAAYTVLAALVRDALEGRSTTREILRSLARPAYAKRRVEVSLRVSPRRRRTA